jgi:hypothetical protein
MYAAAKTATGSPLTGVTTQEPSPQVLHKGDDLAEAEDAEGKHVLAGLHRLEPHKGNLQN